MRKAFVWMLMAILVTSLVGCASGSISGNLRDPNNPSIEMVRAAARIGLAVTLRQHGVSAERTNEILTELHAIADAVIAGEGLGVVLTTRWPAVRSGTIIRVTKAITTFSTVDEVATVDDLTARMLATSVVDSFAGAIRRMLDKGTVIGPDLPPQPGELP